MTSYMCQLTPLGWQGSLGCPKESLQTMKEHVLDERIGSYDWGEKGCMNFHSA